MEFIDLKTQQTRIRKRIETRLFKVLNDGQYILGPEVAELEKVLGLYVGTRHCITNASGTDALLLALMAIDVKPGDEIITTPFSFFATGEVISILGARPVFVDIDPDTYNVDPKKIEAAITAKTKAIIPVSLYGLIADIDPINEIASKNKIAVFEDAAQSFGATYKGRKSCSLTSISCTSFFPSKPLGGYGDSGACFTDNDELANKMRILRTHGQKSRYNHTHVGINSRMDTMQAAILLAKMEIFEEEVSLRQKIGARYVELLGSHLKVQKTPTNQTNVFAQFTVEVDNRKVVQEKLQQLGVPTAVHYPIPMHLQPVYQDLGYKTGDFPASEKAAERVMSLPMHPYLDEKTQDEIVEKLLKVIL